MSTEREIYLEQVVETLSETLSEKVSNLSEINRRLYSALDNVAQKLNVTLEYVKEELRNADQK